MNNDTYRSSTKLNIKWEGCPGLRDCRFPYRSCSRTDFETIVLRLIKWVVSSRYGHCIMLFYNLYVVYIMDVLRDSSPQMVVNVRQVTYLYVEFQVTNP